MPTVLVTGCDRGIGREFAEQFAGDGWSVIATHRKLETPVAGGAHVGNHTLDVTCARHFTELKQACGGMPVDLLVSNAGIGLDTHRLGGLDFDYFRTMYEVNTLGPLRLVDTFLDNLAAGRRPRIVFITSRMGSVGANLSGAHYGYRASKAGLNAIARSLAIDLFPRGVTVTLLHPGWVDTEGGGTDAPLPVRESVASMRSVLRRLGSHETGQFLNYNGSPLPW
jgi:NAD(P)-dependent dehydrogenase (short-subunit alcohol dehydrogenase family)